MNKIILYVLLLVIGVGCKKIDRLTQFHMTYNESIIIQSSTGTQLPFTVFTPDIQSNAESTFAVNDTRKDLIETIHLTQLNLKITAPDNSNFRFLKKIELFIVAEDLEEKRIAWKEDIPEDIEKFLSLHISNEDLKEYIKKEKFTLRVNTVTDEILISDHHIDIQSSFFVDSKVLGQ